MKYFFRVPLHLLLLLASQTCGKRLSVPLFLFSSMSLRGQPPSLVSRRCNDQVHSTSQCWGFHSGKSWRYGVANLWDSWHQSEGRGAEVAEERRGSQPEWPKQENRQRSVHHTRHPWRSCSHFHLLFGKKLNRFSLSHPGSLMWVYLSTFLLIFLKICVKVWKR